jgi:hypothetical protein
MRSICFVLLLFLAFCPVAAAGEKQPNALNLYWGRMTTNAWEDVLRPGEVDRYPSSLVALTLARTIGASGELLSYETEGQLVRHYGRQDHWEFNVLAGLRWEPFWWDRLLDTSLAFGLGASYATRRPPVELAKTGETERLLAYWVLELALALPDRPQLALIVRLHHRSGAYGLFANEGASTAPAIGLKYRF